MEWNDTMFSKVLSHFLLKAGAKRPVTVVIEEEEPHDFWEVNKAIDL